MKEATPSSRNSLSKDKREKSGFKKGSVGGSVLLASRVAGGKMTGKEDRPCQPERALHAGLRSVGFAKRDMEEVGLKCEG